MTQKIAFLGAGNMASALIRGLIAGGYPADAILASDPDQEKLHHLHTALGITIHPTNSDAVSHCDVAVLAVKPQMLESLCKEIHTVAQQKRPLVVSIAAGVTCPTLASWLGESLPIVRTMPNTPASVNCGATGLFATSHVSEEQKNFSETLMRSVGLTAWVSEETQLDIVTALSGSGPAYYFLMMEAMEKAATQLGLPVETARILTIQTAYGAAKMALESEEDAATLRHRVTSPGGTTEQAINTFEQNQFTDLVASAVSAANNRSRELASQFGGEK